MTLLLFTVLCTTLSQLCQKQASLMAASAPWKLLFWLLLAGCWLGGGIYPLDNGITAHATVPRLSTAQP